MHTYVINTSENKKFDSNLLFDLANYNQIQWMWCSLPKIRECAEEIFKTEIVPIPSRDFRVVVLVDFFKYRFASRTNLGDGSNTVSDSPGEYVAIYKNFIGHYLLAHLFDYLRKKGMPARECEIYFVQYHNEPDSETNEMRMVQTAHMFNVDPETEILKNKKRAATAEEDADGDTDEEKGKGKKKKTAEQADDLPIHTEFTLYCNDSVSLTLPPPPSKVAEKTGSTFEAFYHYYTFDRSKDLDNFPVKIHPPYVSLRETDNAAAFDTLSLSLYLIYLYERLDTVTGDPKILKPDPTKLKNLIMKAYQNVHQARSSIQKSCMYYKLEVTAENEDKIGNLEDQTDAITEEAVKDPRNREEVSKLVPSTEDVDALYKDVLRFAEMDDSLQSEMNRQEMNKLMKDYLAARDAKRDGSATVDLKTFKQTESYPSPMDLKLAKEEKNKKLQKLLKLALDADYVSTDYSEKKKEAEQCRENYHRLCAKMRGKLLADIIFFVLSVGLLVGSYALLQLVGMNAFFSSLAIGISATVFAVLYALSFALHILPLASMIKGERLRMRRICTDCYVMHSLSFKKLSKRYENLLPLIEDVRYSLRVLDRLDRANKMKNVHVEAHQKMLESVEETLIGMHNSFGITVLPTGGAYSEDDVCSINVEKPYHHPENRIYQILSIDSIAKMMPKEEANN